MMVSPRNILIFVSVGIVVLALLAGGLFWWLNKTGSFETNGRVEIQRGNTGGDYKNDWQTYINTALAFEVHYPSYPDGWVFREECGINYPSGNSTIDFCFFPHQQNEDYSVSITKEMPSILITRRPKVDYLEGTDTLALWLKTRSEDSESSLQLLGYYEARGVLWYELIDAAELVPFYKIVAEKGDFVWEISVPHIREKEISSLREYDPRIYDVISTFTFLELEDAPYMSCQELLRQAGRFAPRYYEGGSERILNECESYLNKSCISDQECGPFPCVSELCFIKTCDSDDQCPGFCGLHATPVPRFCTTQDDI